MATFIFQELTGPHGYFKFYTEANGLETDSAEANAFSWEDDTESEEYGKDLEDAYPGRFERVSSTNPPTGGDRPDKPPIIP